MPVVSVGVEECPGFWRSTRGRLSGLESQHFHFPPRFITLDRLLSFPDLSLLLRKSLGNPFQSLGVDEMFVEGPAVLANHTDSSFFSSQVPQRTSSIATALNTSGAGGSRPAQAVRAR